MSQRDLPQHKGHKPAPPPTFVPLADLEGALAYPADGLDTDDAEPEDWRDRALCAQVDPETFFPPKGGSTREAQDICSRCPVKAECLEYALANDERFGVWGGVPESRRRKMRRTRNHTAQAQALGVAA